MSIQPSRPFCSFFFVSTPFPRITNKLHLFVQYRDVMNGYNGTIFAYGRNNIQKSK